MLACRGGFQTRPLYGVCQGGRNGPANSSCFLAFLLSSLLPFWRVSSFAETFLHLDATFFLTLPRRQNLLVDSVLRRGQQTNGGTTGAGGPCSSAFVLMACATAIDDVVPLKISACLEKPPFCPIRTRWVSVACAAPRARVEWRDTLKSRDRRQFVILAWAVNNACGRDRITLYPVRENPFTTETPVP